MGVEPKIVFFSPQIIHFNRVFHYFHHPFWDTLIFGSTHILANPCFSDQEPMKFIEVSYESRWKKTQSKLHKECCDKLPETNIAPENGWLEYYFPFGMAYFQGPC